MAIRAAAIAVVNVATLRQRRACADKRMTLEVSATAGGSTASEVTGGASGSISAAWASERPIADLILFQTSGRGSTEPTIWFKTPSLCCHASTIAANSLSADIMVL